LVIVNDFFYLYNLLLIYLIKYLHKLFYLHYNFLYKKNYNEIAYTLGAFLKTKFTTHEERVRVR